ncbi:hypothetical protein SAMN05216389_103200 [Oceanobacillus limi]|uniref:Uncharacterized protein n=1 Tax=Oceanobacillus limi TaxID=930131 RepID=A0A1I0ADR7_9BACI|nr:hypothetical protein SAMN05216389_103200 [Oceanobacillus limi]
MGRNYMNNCNPIKVKSFRKGFMYVLVFPLLLFVVYKKVRRNEEYVRI